MSVRLTEVVVRLFIALSMSVLLLSACSASQNSQPAPTTEPTELAVEIVNPGSNICEQLSEQLGAPCYPYIFAEPVTASPVNSMESTRCSDNQPQRCWPLPGAQLQAVCQVWAQDQLWYGVIVTHLINLTEAAIPHQYKGEPLGYLQAVTTSRPEGAPLDDCANVIK